MVNRLISNIIISCGIALAGFSASAAPGDSIRVVKGQISDYFITVTKTRTIEGVVRDENGKPLEGATVMFFASPMHCTTDKDGRYAIKGSEGDRRLYVYYPGKEIVDMPLELDELNVDVTLKPDNRNNIAQRRPAVATRWYNPATYKSHTYCNPMNISYNYEPYNNNVKPNGSFRSSADPMALTYKDEYFLFSTNQGGFHYSKNLTDWEFAPASFQRHPTDDDQCAPAAYVSGDTLFYTGSTYYGLPVWYATQPKGGRFKKAIECGVLPWWNPYFFLDDDGKLYLYYGSSNEYPMKGVQVSRDDFHPLSKIHDLLVLHPKEHGWERFGMNNDDEVTLAPFTEGMSMTKHNGKYYLQYGAPGTEFKVYADGVYVSDSPLGPFTYQKHNPMSYKPGGFVQGSGHGGTFKDVKGNYWHVSTCMLSLKYKFERRIGLYPTAFDADGVMYSSSAFGDYPNWNADYDIKNPSERFTGWMLLSLGKNVTVSSTDSIFEAKNLTDESMRTYWAAKSGKPGEWLEIDLGGMKQVKAIQLNYYDYKTVQHNRANDVYYQYRIYASNDGKSWELIVDKSDNDRDCPHDYIELQADLSTRYLKLENIHVPSGHFCLSEFRVFGTADGDAPKAVKGLKVVRDKNDRRNAMISWNKSADAYGYNIYYGIAPDKMYNVITVYGDTFYDMRGLDLATDYYFAIEALNESGVSVKSKILKQ